jgi:hypothetical protein
MTSVLVIHVTPTEGFVAEILVIIANKNSEEINVFLEFHRASSFNFSLLDLDIYRVVKPQKTFILIALASEIFVNSSFVSTV